MLRTDVHVLPVYDSLIESHDILYLEVVREELETNLYVLYK
jgi:hypothetical protein